MRAAKDAAYDAVDSAGIRYDPKDVRQLAKDMRGRLNSASADVELHKPAFVRADRFARRAAIRNPKPEVDVGTLSAIDDQRQLISRDVQGGGGISEMGGILRQTLDDFVEKVQPRNATAPEANKLIKTAREANRKLAVRRDVDKAVTRRTHSSSFGGEKGPFKALANSDLRGWAPKEKELLEKVVMGEGWEELLTNRIVDATSKLGSIGTGATAGGLLGGVPGAMMGAGASLVAPPLAKKAARGYTQRNVEALLDELGGGAVITPMVRDFMNRVGGGIGGGEAAKATIDAKKRRKRRKQDDDEIQLPPLTVN